MKKVIIGLLAVFLITLASACASSPASVMQDSEGGMPVPAPAPNMDMAMGSRVAPTAPSVVESPKEDSGGGVYDESSSFDRMIVRTAQMALVVPDVPGALDQITVMAQGADGYVVSSQRWQEEDRMAGFISIRVPADDFGNIMAALRNLAVEVTSEDTSSTDVTEEYVDLTAKLKNLEATEEQLVRLMDKAEEMEDILNIQRELSKTRGEIEQTKGRMQYLERTSATSLISIHLSESGLEVTFSATKRAVKEGEKVSFESRIGGGFTPYSFEWDFGDGETSTAVNPTHTYKTAGYYNVTLKVTDDRGNHGSRSREGYIEVLSGWNPGNVVGGAWNGLVIFGQVLLNILIWIVIFCPIWIIGGGIFFWVRHRRRKKAAK